MPKHFDCSGWGGQHKRAVGVKCQFRNNVDSDSSVSGINTDGNTSDTVNHEILNALTSVSSRLTAIEQHIQRISCRKGLLSSEGVTSTTASVGSY